MQKNEMKKDMSMTYREVYEKWFALYSLSVKASTAISVKSVFDNHILPEIGENTIDAITIDMVQALVLEWRTKVKTYRNIKIQMSRVFDYAIRMEYLRRNPCKHIIMPKPIEYKNEKFKFWHKDELKEFLEIIKKSEDFKWYVFFRLLAFSGMRKGEALALTWDDINFEDAEIEINKTLSKSFKDNKFIDSPKTKSSNRSIDIDEKTLDVLVELKKRRLKIGKRKNRNIVFYNGNLEYYHPSQPLKVLQRIIKKHQLSPITVHGLRHTHCSLLFESGASIKEVQERLGHSDIHTTMNIYTHVSKSKKIEVAQKFATYLSF